MALETQVLEFMSRLQGEDPCLEQFVTRTTTQGLACSEDNSREWTKLRSRIYVIIFSVFHIKYRICCLNAPFFFGGGFRVPGIESRLALNLLCI